MNRDQYTLVGKKTDAELDLLEFVEGKALTKMLAEKDAANQRAGKADADATEKAVQERLGAAVAEVQAKLDAATEQHKADMEAAGVKHAEELAGLKQAIADRDEWRKLAEHNYAVRADELEKVNRQVQTMEGHPDVVAERAKQAEEARQVAIAEFKAKAEAMGYVVLPAELAK